jgi:hypothetical protein
LKYKDWLICEVVRVFIDVNQNLLHPVAQVTLDISWQAQHCLAVSVNFLNPTANLEDSRIKTEVNEG